MYELHAINLWKPNPPHIRLTTGVKGWQCTPAAFAMAVGWPFESLLEAVGHDGSEVWWPEQPEPKCYRGFHFQEIIRVLLRSGFAVTELQRVPSSQGAPNVEPRAIGGVRELTEAWLGAIAGRRAVLYGVGGKAMHAVAWDGNLKRIFDSRGHIYSIDAAPVPFTPLSAYIITPVAVDTDD